MNFWDYLRREAAKTLTSTIMNEYREVGELHRQHSQKMGMEE